jgi:hypothetical protein
MMGAIIILAAGILTFFMKASSSLIRQKDHRWLRSLQLSILKYLPSRRSGRRSSVEAV